MRLRATGGNGIQIDEQELRRACHLLMVGDGAVELRLLTSGECRVVQQNDIEGIVRACKALAERGGLMLCQCLGTLPKDHDGNASDRHVIRRRWLVIDVDPRKGQGHEDDSASDLEHEAAYAKARAITDDLTGHGWPAPIFVDSGNGIHLYYRIDMDNGRHEASACHALLKSVKSRYDDETAIIDPKMANASRVCKLPGTQGKKGLETDERPHRIARIISAPAVAEIVPLEKIQATTEAMRGEKKQAAPKPASFRLKDFPNSGMVESYVRKAFNGELDKLARATQGERNDWLNKCAYSIGQYLHYGFYTREHAEHALNQVACQIGLDKDPGCGQRGIDKTIESGMGDGEKNPRYAPDQNEAKETENQDAEDGEEDCGEEGYILRASDVVPRKVTWLWPFRIPQGKLTTFAGIGGIGKTFVLCDIAARVSRGTDWPDLPGKGSEPGQVLFISGEDAPDDTLVPRMIEIGADLRNISFLKPRRRSRFTLRDLPMLSKAIEEMGEKTKLIAIDPPTAFLSGTDDHKNADLRQILTPLSEWADEHNIAIIFNTHVNKGGGQKVDAVMRVMGSVAWVFAVRAAHIFAPDPDKEGVTLFIPMKNNLAKKRNGLSYELEECGDEMAKVKWTGEVNITANEAINKDRRQPRRAQARDLLVEMFNKKTEWDGREFWDHLKVHGVSKDSMYRAKHALGLPSPRRKCEPNGDIVYTWYAPRDWEFLDSVHKDTETGEA